MHHLFTLALLCITASSITFGQTPCACEQAFEKLTTKLEANYIALKLDPKEGWDAHKTQFQREAAQTKPELCSAFLTKYLKFFNDGHLFVAEYPEYSPTQLEGFKQQTKSGMSTAQVLQYFETNKNALHPLEGFWADGQSKFGVIRVTQLEGYSFAAIILEHAQREKVGEFKLLVAEGEAMAGKYFTNAYVPRYVAPQLLRGNTLLNLGGGLFWSRAEPDAPSANPIAPTFKKWNSETALLTIPSFLIEKKELDAVLDNHENALKSSRFLIIDIRGNTGGNGIYFEILKWFAKRSFQDSPGLALSSPDNINYFERMAGGKKNLYSVVAENMKKNPGKIVDGPFYQSITLKPIKSTLEKVAILTDGANASAAEQFVLHAKMAGEVTTIGQPTAGVIDYQSINMVKLDCLPMGIQFGYPTSTLNKNIPKDGFNRNGITPDILSEKSGDALVQLAVEYFTKPK